MDANTAFDRKPDRVPHSASASVPLTKRRWFRLVALTIIVICVLAGILTATLLAN